MAFSCNRSSSQYHSRTHARTLALRHEPHDDDDEDDGLLDNDDDDGGC